uniref:Uncharacterized protein n=1 Tax=Romanomermis culicivorax TaxID=13658 RepID=A0A915KNK4_ROMCU
MLLAAIKNVLSLYANVTILQNPYISANSVVVENDKRATDDYCGKAHNLVLPLYSDDGPSTVHAVLVGHNFRERLRIVHAEAYSLAFFDVMPSS